MASQSIVVGLWGGTGSQAWDDGFYTGVRTIELTHGESIFSFNVTYDLNGKPYEGPKHDSDQDQPPFTPAKIDLQFPDEYLVSVSGYTGFDPWFRNSLVRSLTFKTNQRTYGPYGKEEGTHFSLPIQNGKIVGFKGITALGRLVAIGIHLAH